MEFIGKPLYLSANLELCIRFYLKVHFSTNWPVAATGDRVAGTDLTRYLQLILNVSVYCFPTRYRVAATDVGRRVA